jgi:hypothetical protein
MKMTTQYYADRLDRKAISQAILVLVLATRNQKSPEIKESMEQYIARVVGWVCREMHQLADFTSQAAKEIATEELHMTLDALFAMRWDQQPRVDPGRQKLRFEHVYPIGHAVAEIITMPDPTVEAAEAILAKLAVCWVTAAEDRKLGRSYRPDPWQGYANAGIVVLDRTGRRRIR